MNKLSQKFLTNSREKYNVRCLQKVPITSFLYEQKSITIGILLTLVAKNNKTVKPRYTTTWICHATTWLKFPFFTPPYHDAACFIHAAAYWSLEFDCNLLMLRHALVFCPALLVLTPFCFQWLVLQYFYLKITYKIKYT